MREKERLQKYLEEITRQDCAVAFSGGVDSSLLLAMVVEAADKNHTRVLAVTFDTKLHPAADAAVAKRVAEELRAELAVLAVSELSNPEILDNPKNRCYLCKKGLFETFRAYADAQNITVLLEGSNADDLKIYRPGLQAVKELGILSPLAECAITKKTVRALAQEYGISVAERPSTPCMATRLPYGVRIYPEVLRRIEQGEQAVKNMGFCNVRLRLHGDVVRLELDREELMLAVKKNEALVQELKALGFQYITLDLQGFRSGSMDERLFE